MDTLMIDAFEIPSGSSDPTRTCVHGPRRPHPPANQIRWVKRDYNVQFYTFLWPGVLSWDNFDPTQHKFRLFFFLRWTTATVTPWLKILDITI